MANDSDPTWSTLRLHHVGFVAAAVEPAAASFCDRFGYRRVTAVLHDPTQTALVQFLALPAAGLPYVEIVAPDSPSSRLSASAKRGGLHHLCYTAGPLEAEVARMRDLDMLLIAEPLAAVAFAGRRICWLAGGETGLIELVERRDDTDVCLPR